MRTYDGLGSMKLLPLGNHGSLEVNKALKDLSFIRDDNNVRKANRSARSVWVREPCYHFCLARFLQGDHIELNIAMSLPD
jgi:hypothetical protein